MTPEWTGSFASTLLANGQATGAGWPRRQRGGISTAGRAVWHYATPAQNLERTRVARPENSPRDRLPAVRYRAATFGIRACWNQQQAASMPWLRGLHLVSRCLIQRLCWYVQCLADLKNEFFRKKMQYRRERGGRPKECEEEEKP